MIGQLHGTLLPYPGSESSLIKIEGALGTSISYEVFLADSVFDRLHTQPQPITLYIHTEYREDGVELFGFEHAEDRVWFRALRKVSRLGGRLAQRVLGRLGCKGLAAAVVNKDLSELVKISGVGKKVAEKIVFELRGKLPTISYAGVSEGSYESQQFSFPSKKVQAALHSLGFSDHEIDRALSSLSQREDDQRSDEELLREAIHFLRPLPPST